MFYKITTGLTLLRNGLSLQYSQTSFGGKIWRENNERHSDERHCDANEFYYSNPSDNCKKKTANL